MFSARNSEVIHSGAHMCHTACKEEADDKAYSELIEPAGPYAHTNP